MYVEYLLICPYFKKYDKLFTIDIFKRKNIFVSLLFLNLNLF